MLGWNRNLCKLYHSFRTFDILIYSTNESRFCKVWGLRRDACARGLTRGIKTIWKIVRVSFLFPLPWVNTNILVNDAFKELQLSRVRRGSLIFAQQWQFAALMNVSDVFVNKSWLEFTFDFTPALIRYVERDKYNFPSFFFGRAIYSQFVDLT